MAKNTKQALVFDCFKCKKTSSYPSYLKEGEEKDKVKSVVKRCLTCGVENTVKVPDGWSAERDGQVLRGLE